MAHPLLSPTFPNLRIDAVWVPPSPKCGTLCECQRELPLKTSQNSRTSELASTVAKGILSTFTVAFHGTPRRKMEVMCDLGISDDDDDDGNTVKV